ncbi:MAG: UDP-4-amino-4,6-dideoxy-N-acetyl-beta-L-altrosamine N-acetyltransferase [Knoellia sp.]
MLRPATDADSANVLQWRNHPEVRAVSLTQHEISAEEHAGWWAATNESHSRKVYIFERHGEPSGVVTFFDIDRENRSAWWGYYLDNAGLGERGELLPAWIEIQRQAKRFAFEQLDLQTLEGEVLEANDAVRRFNKRNGFAEIESSVRDVDGTPTTVIHVRATRD